MNDYKTDIKNTRFGCVGSSDAAMLAKVAEYGEVQKSSYQRLAVVKGLIQNEEIPYTDAVRFGDLTEQSIYDMLHKKDERYESNPCWESKRYSRPNVKCITHPDIVLKDEEKKVLYVYEVKASRYDTNAVRRIYNAQLYYHSLLAKEYAAYLGREWVVKVFLAHYNTDGLDLSVDNEFDTDRLTIRETRFASASFDLDKAMDIVNDFLSTFNFYSRGEEIDADLLPIDVKAEFDAITQTIREIKERETKVDGFKKRLYAFLKEKNIKSISNAYFSISRIDETEVKSFDYKHFLEDFAAKHPRKANKLKREYEKTTKKKGYATIKLKNKE